MKFKHAVIAFLSTLSVSFGASTLSVRNFSSATVGVPIIDSSGTALAVGSFFMNGGYFNAPINFGTATISDIQTTFVPIDSTPLSGGTRNGLLTGQTFNGVLPVGFAGKDAYVVVANNSDFALATLFAVFDANATFAAPDGLGNSAQTLDALLSSNVVFGATAPVTTQPNNLTGADFATGVQMVPEPSAALLGAIGAIGLLRRRRN